MSKRRTATAALAAVLGLAVWPGAEANASQGACVGTSGVTVVVDYGALGGGIEVRCAPGDPSSALQALSAAGFSYGFVPRQPGMVCQINTTPNPCNGAPTNAYWAYSYVEPRGTDWVYSQVGAGGRDPKPGGVEGWAFGDGRAPSLNPPAPKPTTTTTSPAPTPAPRPPSTPPPPSGGGRPEPGPAAPPATDAVGTEQPTSPDADTNRSETTVADGGTSTDADDDASPEATDETPADLPGDEASAAETNASEKIGAETVSREPREAPGPTNGTDQGDGSLPVATIAGVLLVAGLGGGGWLISRRRRATGNAPSS